jgi:hypothetical protein
MFRNLAGVLKSRGKYAEATELYEKACAGHTKVLGKDHPYTRTCRENYALMLRSQKENCPTGVSEVSQVGKHGGNSKESMLSRVVRKLRLRSLKPGVIP